MGYETKALVNVYVGQDFSFFESCSNAELVMEIQELRRHNDKFIARVYMRALLSFSVLVIVMLLIPENL